MKGVFEMAQMTDKILQELRRRDALERLCAGTHVHSGQFVIERRPDFNSVVDFIEKVVFNDPYTIILWKDKSKTIVKVLEGDEFVPETGVAVAICKKLFGSRADFKRFVANYTPEEKEKVSDPLYDTLVGFTDAVRKNFM